MKVLITGGTGFIGSHLALRYLEDGHQVQVLGQVNTASESTNRDSLEAAGASIVLGSITDSTLLEDLVDGTEVVVHLAATQHEMNVPDERFSEVNVDGTRKVLDASRQAGVTRFVHGSTIGVYGPAEGVVDEAAPCRPDNIYGRTKLEGERVALGYRDRLAVTVIRIPEVYGPGDRRLLKLFRAIERGHFFVVGDGENMHHPAYVDDLVDGLILAAAHPSAAGEVLGLAGPQPVSTNEMVRDICLALGRPQPRLKAPMAPFAALAVMLELTLRPLGVQPPLHRRRLDFFRKSFVISADKARSLIGFSPQVGFDSGARVTALWYKDIGML
jgi:nucleoside-diphosphate-sugar epimerase